MGPVNCATNHGFLPGLYDNVPCDATGNLDIQSVQDVLKIAGNVVRILIALSGGIAVIVIVVAAIYYISSRGDSGQVKQAKEILQNMTIGLIIIMASYAIVTYIARGF